MLLVLVIAGNVFRLRIRKLFIDDEQPTDLILDDIRTLRNKGTISDEEYERLREVILGTAHGQSQKTPPATIVAPPGFDLTGDPLPGPPQDRESPPESSESSANE